MVSRRSVLKSVVFGSFAGFFSFSAFGRGAQKPAAAPVPPSDNSVWKLLAPLQPGEEVGFDWRVEAITPVVNGAVILTLRNANGATANVRICRNDGSPRGVAHTTEFDLILLNGGDGHVETEEGLARVLRQIAAVLSGNETTIHPFLLATVRTHDEHLEIAKALSALV